MKKVLKWVGIVAGGLLILVGIVLGTLTFRANRALAGPYKLEVAAIDIPTDEASLARGEHLVEVVSDCVGCHGADLAGTVFMDEPPFGLVTAPNLTAGQGGIGGSYSDSDWVRAIRHGVGPNGQALAFMPSQYYYYYGDEDLGAMIAYLKSIPPVDNVVEPSAMIFPGPVVLNSVLGVPAAYLDHKTRPDVPEQSVTAVYGEFLATVAGCQECHGASLAGLVEEMGPPPGPNLTPGGNLAGWSQEDFFSAMRNGVTPEGQVLDPELMPWPAIGNMTDEELQAIWLYLESLPARELGNNE